MSTDTPSGESGELNVDSAAAAFGAMLEPPKEEEQKVDTEVDPPKAEAEVEAEPSAEESDDAPLTIEVDGKQVTLTKAEIAEHYKNGLRQGDYTQKTMALAEQRKAAEAQTQQAQQERHAYASNLQKMAAQLEGAIEHQSQIDWNALLESDPVEFLKQKHLYDQRQAALQQNRQQQHIVGQQNQAEQEEALKGHLQKQQDELLAKLPQWKDGAKASAERTALRAYLLKEGYAESDVQNIHDHKAVILGRKAMLYDQMMDKARAAAKKVQNVPQKVERPGVGTDRNAALDGRTAAMRNHGKTGSVESAAAVFAQLI